MIEGEQNKKQTEFDRLKTFIERLCGQVKVLSDCFVVYKYLRYSDSEQAPAHKCEVFSQYGFFFGSIQPALYRYSVVTIVNLVDGDNSYGISKYLESCEQNLKSIVTEELKRKKNTSEILRQKKSFKEFKPLDAFIFRRNKSDAHFDKDYLLGLKSIDEDFDIKIEDVQKILTMFHEVLNWHRENIFYLGAYPWPDLNDFKHPRDVMQDLAVAHQLREEDGDIYLEMTAKWHRRLNETN